MAVEIALLTTLMVVMAGSFWQQFNNYVKLRDLIERSNKDTRDLIERSNKDTRDSTRNLIERSHNDLRDLIETGLAEHSAQLREHNVHLRAIDERLSDLGERTARIEGILSERERRDPEPGDGRSDAA